MNEALFYALGASFFFSIASLVFTHYARKVSVMWMNCFKATTALIAFSLAVFFTTDREVRPETSSLVLFFISGLLGLNIGDWFLVKAFQTIGPARTLVIFSFQPLFLGALSFLILGQTVSPIKFAGILFMIACVFTLSYERFRQERKWDMRGPIYALVGVVLDSFGIMLTRQAFEWDRSISVLEGNFYRVIGAIVGFAIMSRFVRIDLVKTYFKLNLKSQIIVFAGGLLGTFISLCFFLRAVSTGNLALVTAVTGAGPVFAAIFECLIQRKWPSTYLIVAFLFFGGGFFFILQ